MNTTIKAKNRILCLVLALCLLLTMVLVLPGPVEVSAANPGTEGDANDGINFDTLIEDGLYYGKYNHAGPTSSTVTPILWQIMGEDPDTGNYVALSEYVLANNQIFSSSGNAYAGSNIQNWLNDTFAGTSNFPGAEEHFALPTSISTRLYDVGDGNPITNTTYGGEDYDGYGIAKTPVTQKFYLPWGTMGYDIGTGSFKDWPDYNNNKVGWDSGADKESESVLADAIARTKGGNPTLYWLRSPLSAYSDNALSVNPVGHVYGVIVDITLGVRPAFQFNPSSVIFTSEIKSAPIEDWETEADGTYYSDAAGVGAKNYKLTIVNPDLELHSLSVTDGRLGGSGSSLTINSGSTLTVTGDFSGGADHLVYKIVDRGSNTIVGYGKGTGASVDIAASANVTGGGNLSASGSYTLYVWAQEDKTINSHEGSEPMWFKLNVGTANSDASLVSVAGETVTTGSGAGTSNAPYTDSISLDNSVDKIEITDIAPADTNARVNLYTDANFTQNEDQPITLSPNTSTDLYIKVTAEDGTTMRYYKITATRDGLPIVTVVSPDGNNVSVGTSSLSITFDKEMDTQTPIVGTVSLNPSATVANGQWQLDDRTVKYDLSGLGYDKTYTVTIEDFEDASNNVMLPDSSHTFTTEAEPSSSATLTMIQPGNDTVKVDEPYTKNIEVNYTGSNIPLGFSASGLPPTLSIDPDNGTISGTPNTADTHNITVTATAGPLSDSKSFTLDVTSTATPTQLTLEAPTDLTVTEGEPFTKRFSVTYQGLGTLEYDIDGLPAGVSYSPATGVITGPATQSGVFPIDVVVTDGTETDNGGFDLIVLPASSPPPQSSHTITASAGIGGSITPSGKVTVADGDDQIFTTTPNENYKISDVLVDYVSEGDVATYTFQNVTGDHTIHVTFESIGGGSVNPDPDPTPTPSGSTRSGRSSSSGGSTYTPPPKTTLPASAFAWEGRTLTIDHDSITPLGLLSVQWDGQPLTRGTDYGVYQGSVIVRFGEDFMAAQSPGDHTIRVEFLNHTGETTVTVGDTGLTTGEPNDDLFNNDTHNPNTGGYSDGSYPGADNPNTGDGRGIWTALLLGSLGAAALVKLRPRLRVKN